MAEKFNIGDYFKNDTGEVELDISKDGNFSDYLAGLMYKQGNLINNAPGGIFKDKNMSNYKTSENQNKSLVSDFGGNIPKPRDISLPFGFTIQDLLNFKNAPIETVANSSFAESLASGYNDVKGTTSQVIENIKNSDYMKDSKEVAQDRKNKETMNAGPPGRGDATVTLSDMIMSDGVIDLLNSKPFAKKPMSRIDALKAMTSDDAYTDQGIANLKTEKDKPKKETKTEKKTEEKEQGLMSKIMNGLMSNPEFGLTVAESLMSGGGLMPGITKGARAQTAVNAAKAQAEINNLLKKSQMDKNNRIKELSLADSYARSYGEPGSPEYDSKFSEYLYLNVKDDDDEESMTDVIKGGAMLADPTKMLDIINQKLNKSSTTGKATPTNAYDLVGY
tara:strand:- start:27 stop:1199 length:1173 start_codon:yes stop_codon:yes gene_type:complete